MRLTLRTLLAYLDDVLDPTDKEELAQKIESSDFAEDLVHRTRDTVRRLRLSAPQLIGTGMGLDPNSVAEYLDNVMPPDAVGDFERICLESDVHLAEAAACHHVLTMILGQPADVDPLTRQRMYTIATEAGERKRLRMEPAHKTAAAVSQGVPVAPPVAVERPRAVEVPEYLRTGRWWRSWSALAGLAALVIVGIAILLATGLGGWFGGKSTVAELSPNVSAPATEVESPSATPMANQPSSSTQTESVAAAGGPAATARSLGSPPQPLTPGIASPPPSTVSSNEPDRYSVSNPAENAVVPPPQASETDVIPPAPETPLTGGPASNPVGAGPSAQPAPGDATANIPPKPPAPLPEAAANPPLPPQPATSLPSTTNLKSEAPAASNIAAVETPPVPAPSEANTNAEKAQVPAGPPELGTYMGGKTVLLRYDGKTGTWFRIEPRAAVVANERLLALPEFRPKIALICGLHLDLSGGTQVVLGNGGNAKTGESAVKPEGAAAASEIPTIEVVYGRIVLMNPTSGENRVRLKLGPSAGEAQLERKSTLAVEVERKHVPGQDPQKTPAPMECRLFAPDGGVVWKDGAGTKTVDKPSRWTVSVAGATEPVADPAPPEWIDREPIVQLSDQRYGAPVVESTLVSNVPADTQLLELFQGSKERYVKSLVTRCSIHVGLFVPFIDALRDSEQKSNWKTHIDALRAAMALSPESAEKVKLALEDQRGKPAAKDLYEMLCGYSAEQIGRTPDEMKSGAVVNLIDWLEQDSLDYRVLAVQDLWEATGKRLMLNPAAGVAERTRNIRAWRTQLKEGSLKPVSPPQ